MERSSLWLLISAIFISANSFTQDYCTGERFNSYIFNAGQTERIANIEYGEAVNNLGNTEQLYLDIYRPLPGLDELLKKPLVMFVHGGGLVGGSKESEGATDIGEAYAELGFIFASINYRIGWDNGEDDEFCMGDTADLFRAEYRGVQDVKAAYRFLKANADVYGIDTNFIFVEGNSAGSTLLLYASYASQEDFDQMYYDELGSIDSSGNTLYGYDFNPKGIMLEAGGIEDSSLLYKKDIPTLYFHGTCDSIVPYFSGPTFSCYQPVRYPVLYGSWEQARILKSLGRTYHLYSGEGAGHDVVIPDSLILYTKEFLKDILCDRLTTTEYYRVLGKHKCAVGNNGELFIQSVYPNPAPEQIFIEVTSSRNRDVDLMVFNSMGQMVIDRTLDFYPPIRTYSVDVAHLPRGIYFMVVSQRQEIYVVKFLK